ncbi:FMN-binding negative transcriptional regulator [uncultured Acinetobacter sp.]|uniref:FMN-binding negative transcriptional regulator n=1 Tax=uncultured Acinetobacter sp. TaxID=165433 RepID=UPI00261C0B52|nr:FMN-binding negative transcriptional regulator [uncultured Acinetobacter sp.]
MSIPQEFQETRPTEIARLIAEYPLACIVAHTTSGLIATHLPMLLKDQTCLVGHMACANELFTQVKAGQEVLCIFKGEDAYISANDYPSKQIDHQKVPTWNYQALHVHGTIEFFHDQKTKLAALGQLTQQQERKTYGKAAWKMADAPRDYLLALLEDLVVFNIQISAIHAISKLSQDKTASDQAGVQLALQQRAELKLAECMQNTHKKPLK